MRRTVAIIGPTPAFLRWAIWQSCPLRELDAEKLTESTFRQLRGIREISIARLEQRIFEDICVHPRASSRDPEAALGFPVAEVVDLFGGQSLIEATCCNCPANAAACRHPGLLAGCYGWLPIDLAVNIEKISRGEPSDEESAATADSKNVDLIELVEWAVADLQLQNAIAENFLVTNPAWYGLWANRRVSQLQLQVLEPVMDRILADLLDGLPENSPQNIRLTDLSRFVTAVSRCSKYLLPLVVDWVPAGYSDGLTWTIPEHCGYCRMPTGVDAQKNCSACGQPGNKRQQIKQKVLGIRPYLLLSTILGREQTGEFLLRYESRNT